VAAPAAPAQRGLAHGLRAEVSSRTIAPAVLGIAAVAIAVRAAARRKASNGLDRADVPEER